MDHALVAEVERRATGADIHRVAQPLTLYSGFWQLSAEDRRPEQAKWAAAAERQLRSFVVQARLSSLAYL